MAINLVVKEPFEGRERGDIIKDPNEIAAVLAGENVAHVVPIDVPAAAAA